MNLLTRLFWRISAPTQGTAKPIPRSTEYVGVPVPAICQAGEYTAKKEGDHWRVGQGNRCWPVALDDEVQAQRIAATLNRNQRYRQQVANI